MLRHANSKRWVVATLLFVALALMPAATAFHGGIAGDQTSGGGPAEVAQNGCTCHGTDPTNAVSVFVLDVPYNYAPGEDSVMSISLAGGPAAGGAYAGGFSLLVSDGTLTPGDGSQLWESDPTRLTHTADGSEFEDRTWEFTWTAPAAGSGTVRFYVTGNAVDGSQAPGPEDQWNRLSFNIPEGDAEDAGGPVRDLFSGNGEVEPPVEEDHGIDLHHLGAALRAHWLGLLGFLSVLLVIIFNGFFLRYGFSHRYQGRTNLLRLRIKHRRRGDQ